MIIAAVVVLAGTASARAQTPTNVRIEGVPGNRHVLSFTPEFCWDFSGTQTNWDFQVDDDPNFELNYNNNPAGAVLFWDSGTQDKGTSNNARCATLRGILLSGFVPLTLDRRAHLIYWRMRVQTNGTTWGPWVQGDLRMNQYPLLAQDMAVVADPVSSNDPVTVVAPKITGKTLYVSPTGNDANAGTLAAPFRTLAKGARMLTKGDTLLMRGGNYDENVLINPAGGYANGEPGNPITVKAYPGERPLLRALSTGTKIAIQVANVNDWVFDGLTVGGASTVQGYYVSDARTITVKNCRWDSSGTVNMTGLFLSDGSEDLRITGCLFDQPLFDHIEISNAKHVEIRNNEFTHFDTRHCIQAHGGSANNIVIADNYFHDGHPFEGVIFLYIGTQGTRVVDNVFANVWIADPNNPSNVGNAWGLVILRGGEIIVENNTFYNLEHSGIQLLEFTSHGTYRNNIFMKCAVGIRYRGGILPGSSTQGVIMDDNIFYNNGTDYIIPTGDLAFLSHPPTGNCFGGPAPSNPACDPKFVNAVAKDFHLLAGSPAIDASDPLSPVPVGGGTRRDIGRFETGAAAPPYEYQSLFTVSDSTPRISWHINDVDNLLGDLPAGDVDFQTKYQLQIDPKHSFDSLSDGRPMLDSGVVSSLVEDYTVPDSRALPTGEYYVRVRQWDDNDFTKGAWSDHNFRFRVSGEPAPPYLASMIPAPAAAGVLETTSIVAHVKDDGVGVNIATVKMYVNGVLVTPTITGGLLEYTLTYQRPTPFPTSSTVTVRIVADDFNLSPPGLDSTYTFTIRDTTPPQPPGNVRVIL
ncbi:MAG TPA: right-handed parallel beta-helix repeat-containing protein [Patescibacteria group bacterium]|nr:right-handed parallel beta-helix repeat-containing protein [Patescibacteria group bacterium]